MKNTFLIMIAALILAACGGNKGKAAKSDSCQRGIGGCPINQSVYPVGHPQVGVPGHYGGHYGGNYGGHHGPIVGTWCSEDSKIRFDQDGAVAITNIYGGFHLGRYTSGALIIGSQVMPVKMTPANASTPSLLYVMVSVGHTEIMEPCADQDQTPDQDDEDDKDHEDSKPSPKPKPKPKPHPKPKPQPTPLPAPPKAT